MNKADRIKYCQLLSASTRTTYDAIGSVYCPILKESVVFNARGFHHMSYEADGTARDINEIIYKLTLFPLAIPTIKFATAIIEERDITMRASRKKGAPMKKAKTYAIVAKVGRKKPVDVRVILLKIGNGNLMFRSIMKH